MCVHSTPVGVSRRENIYTHANSRDSTYTCIYIYIYIYIYYYTMDYPIVI